MCDDPSMPNQFTPRPQDHLSLGVFIVVRLVGPGFIFTGYQIMPTSFPLGVGLIYFGFLVCFVECVRDPWFLQRPYRIQVASLGLLIFLMDVFTITVAFIRAPIDVLAFNVPAQFAPVNIGPVSWKPFFAELDMAFANQTDMTYDRLDILVRPDLYVAGIAQVSNLSDVSFEDRYGLTTHVFIEDENTKTRLNMEFLSTNAGYKVHCGHIPPHSSLKLIMAIVDMTKLPPPKNGPMTVPPYAKMEDFSSQAVVAEKDGTKFFYWYGNKANTHIYTPNPRPASVFVSGSYFAANRTRRLERTVQVSQPSAEFSK